MDRLGQVLESYIVDAKFTGDMREKLHGAAFIVVDDNGPIYQGSAGCSPSATGPVDFNTDTQTWVASLTKIVTVTCLMQLVEKDLVSLDDDVRPRVPELGDMKILRGFHDGVPHLVENTKPITLRNLLTHTVGLGYDLADEDLSRWAQSTGRTVNNLSFTWDGWNTPLKFVPGDGWLYGSAIDWASKLLTAVTGTSLGQYMEEHIFKPLGMNDTSFRPTHSTARACFTRQPDKQIRYDLAPVPAQPPVESGGAGLYTTAADHGKFLAALLKASSGNNNDTRVRLLKKETVDVMFRPQLDPVQHTMFEAAMRQSRESLCPWAGMDVVDQLQHGIGGVINLADVPKKRRQGSMSWVAMNNCHWWIDRQSGIGATLVCNLLPHADSAVNRLYEELELALYEELLPSLKANESAAHRVAGVGGQAQRT